MSAHHSCRDAHAELEHRARLADETADHYGKEALRLRRVLEQIAANRCGPYNMACSCSQIASETLHKERVAELEQDVAKLLAAPPAPGDSDE